MIEISFAGLGQLSEVKSHFEIQYGKIESPKRYRMEFWFEPFIYWEKTIGILIITPFTRYGYINLQVKYAIKGSRWQIGITKQLDNNNLTYFNFEWENRGTASASESGSPSTIR